MAVSPVEEHIASGREDGRLLVMDVATGQPKVDIDAHKDRIRCVAYSRDGKKIATCSDDHIINIWDAENGERLLEPLEGHTDVVMSIGFSPDRNFLVSGTILRWISCRPGVIRRYR
jgi:WD40 repeat protein